MRSQRHDVILKYLCLQNVLSLLHTDRDFYSNSSQFSDPRLIKHAGRKILCHPNFKLYLQTKIAKPNFSPTIASSTTLVNYGSSNETLVDDLLMRAYARVRPELYKERRLALRAVHLNYVGLTQVRRVLTGRGTVSRVY